MTSKTKQEITHMAGKKKAVAMEAKLTVAEKMRKDYETLAVMNAEVAEKMQAAYQFALDNNLIYTAPTVVRDGDDEDYEDSYESSYC